MSQDLKTQNQKVSTESQDVAIQQKKIDPVAQQNWLNNQQVDQGWGVFNNLPAGGQSEQPIQKFAKEEEEDLLAEVNIQEGLQMKPENSLSTEIDSAIQARFGTPVIQRQTEEETTEEETEVETQTYIVTNSNAVIRSDTEPHDETASNKIPLGTKITVIDTYKKDQECNT